MIDVATGAAKQAGEILLSHWRNLPAGSIEEKAKNDFVSIADRESERAIVETILAAFPGDGILGEEGARRPGTSGREWVIDPLDGTSNFIAGFPFWCVSIGVRQGRRIARGSRLGSPAAGDVQRREGERSVSERRTALAVSRRSSAEGAFLATGFPFREHAKIDEYLAIFRALFLKAKAIRRAGSAALDLACVAVGSLRRVLRVPPFPVGHRGGCHPDHGGGRRAAGFRGRLERYFETGDVLAGPPGVVEDILRVIADVRRR